MESLNIFYLHFVEKKKKKTTSILFFSTLENDLLRPFSGLHNTLNLHLQDHTLKTGTLLKIENNSP